MLEAGNITIISVCFFTVFGKNTEESVDNTVSNYDGFAFSRVLIIR